MSDWWKIPCPKCGGDMYRYAQTCGPCYRSRRPYTSPDNLAERFWAKVDKNGECWTWIGGRTTRGYGIFQPWYGQPMTGAHRIAWELANKRAIPDGLEIDHLCRNRSCVNPSHLDAVTHAENIERARPTHCKRGHEFTVENTYLSRNGRRRCRQCVRAAAKTPEARAKHAAYERERKRRLRCPST